MLTNEISSSGPGVDGQNDAALIHEAQGGCSMVEFDFYSLSVLVGAETSQVLGRLWNRTKWQGIKSSCRYAF